MHELTIADLELSFADLTTPVIEVKPPRPVTSPWHATARVLVIEETECTCGAKFSAPGAKGLLVRFERNGSRDIQEMSNHPAGLNPSLPLVKRVLHKIVYICEECTHVA